MNRSPGRRRRRGRGTAIARRLRLCVAAALGLSCLATAALAEPDDATDRIRADLHALEQVLAKPGNLTGSTRDLLEQFRLLDPAAVAVQDGRVALPHPAPPGAGGITGQAMDLRLGLTMLSQTYGSEENPVVLSAQPGPDRKALVLMSGTATLADIRLLLRSTGLQADAGPGALVLDVPLVIWADAQLRLSTGQELHLNRATGAFVLNFGHLAVERAAILATEDPNPASEPFRPFVTTAGGGSVHLDGARISGLGFGHSPKFSGFSVLRSALKRARFPTSIANSAFRDAVGLTISDVADAVVQGNTFHDMRGVAVTLFGSRHGRVVENLFSGSMPTNAIRVLRGSSDAVVSGNVILGGERAGIVVRRDSHAARITGNIVWRRGGGGILMDRSDCGQIEANLVLDNGQKGIEVRASPDARVTRNTVLGNHSAGIWVSALTDTNRTYLDANVLGANGSGVASAAGGDIVLRGNDFSAQFPQFLSGDVTADSHRIARDLTGTAEITLSSTGHKSDPGAVPACFLAEGRT